MTSDPADVSQTGRIMLYFFRATGLSLIACLAACSTPQWAVRVPPLDTPNAQAETVVLLRQAALRPMALGELKVPEAAAVTVGEAMYTEPPVAAAAEAQQLRDTLQAQLQGAALYDVGSKWVLSGAVLSADLRKDHGAVAARFTLKRPDGAVAYERELRASAAWAPALGSVGARWVAKEHGAVYQKLVHQLFSDTPRNTVRVPEARPPTLQRHRVPAGREALTGRVTPGDQGFGPEVSSPSPSPGTARRTSSSIDPPSTPGR
jgi:hypothetical protein